MKQMLLLIVMLWLTACAPAADPHASVNTAAQAGGNYYADPNVYTLQVLVGGESQGHTELRGQGSAFSYGGIGSGSFALWQEGKGLLPVKILSMEPQSTIVHVGDLVIIKTEDLKLARVEPGWVVEIKCRMDYEPLANLNVTNEVTSAETTQTWELDVCRMVTPRFEVNQVVAPETE
jgi:hypothetical protein